MHIWNRGHNCFQELKKGYSNTVDSYLLNLKFISTCFSCSVFMDVKGLNVFYKKKNIIWLLLHIKQYTMAS